LRIPFFRRQEEMLKDWKANVFPQEPIKLLAAKEGKLAVASL
jgi:hypothetical protein